MVGFINSKLPYNNKQYLENGACALSKPSSSWAPNILCTLIHRVSSNFVSHCSYVFHAPPQTYSSLHLLCKLWTAHLFYTLLTNQTPPTSSHYWTPTFCANMESQTYTLTNPFDKGHVRPFLLSLYQPLQLLMIKLQPLPISSMCSQPSLKAPCPTCGHLFTI
jgi:hypothetical protein